MAARELLQRLLLLLLCLLRPSREDEQSQTHHTYLFVIHGQNWAHRNTQKLVLVVQKRCRKGIDAEEQLT